MVMNDRYTKHLVVSDSATVNPSQMAENVILVNSAGQKVSTKTDAELNSRFASRRRGFIGQEKIRGGNIVPRPTTSWATHWTEWDWTNWIKPQVDRVAALGLNTVRMIAAADVVVVGTLTQATYNAQWTQLAAYCQSLGLKLYPCICEGYAFQAGDTPPYDYQAAAPTAVITSSAAALAAYDNVIAFDVFQEGSGQEDGMVVADVVALYAAIRAVAPDVPLTTSNSSGGFGAATTFWNDTSSVPYSAWTAAGGADFIDIHVYLDGALPGDFDTFDTFVTRVGKPVLIGEFGANQAQSSAEQTARYTALAAMHNRPGVLGSIAWALADQSSTDSNKWGLWDNTGFTASTSPLSTVTGKRTAMTNVLPSFVQGERPPTYQPVNLLRPMQARPRNISTATLSGWTVGSNTYTFADSRGLGFSATAIGTTQISTAPVPTHAVPVSASTAYTASVDILGGAATSRTVTLQIDWYDSSNTYLTSTSTTSGATDRYAPVKLTLTVVSHASAAYGVLTVKNTSTLAANEATIIVNASMIAT